MENIAETGTKLSCPPTITCWINLYWSICVQADKYVISQRKVKCRQTLSCLFFFYTKWLTDSSKGGSSLKIYFKNIHFTVCKQQIFTNVTQPHRYRFVQLHTDTYRKLSHHFICKMFGRLCPGQEAPHLNMSTTARRNVNVKYHLR